MRLIKNYLAITNRGYRILWTFVFPAIVVLLANLISAYVSLVSSNIHAGIESSMVLFLVLEVICDFFGFGCICKKGNMGMEYLHTSFWGDRMLLDGISGDMFVRVLRCIIYALLCNIYNLFIGANVSEIIFAGIVTAIISVGSLNVTRYLDMIQYFYLITMPFIGLQVMIVLGIQIGLERIFNNSIMAVVIVLLVAVLVLAGVFLLTYSHMAKKIKDSYIDIK